MSYLTGKYCMDREKYTPAVLDAKKQLRDPQSPGSRGLADLALTKLRDHPMRHWLDVVDNTEKDEEDDADKQ
jgi:hypothetical protein